MHCPHSLRASTREIKALRDFLKLFKLHVGRGENPKPDTGLVKLVPAAELEHLFLRRQRGLARPRDARELVVAQRAHVGGDLLAGNTLLRVVACAIFMAALEFLSANKR
jgi:hypothetical protein